MSSNAGTSADEAWRTRAHDPKGDASRSSHGGHKRSIAVKLGLPPIRRQRPHAMIGPQIITRRSLQPLVLDI
jgi:hypothetical protein